MDLIESQYNYNTNEYLRDPILVGSDYYMKRMPNYGLRIEYGLFLETTLRHVCGCLCRCGRPCYLNTAVLCVQVMLAR